MLINDGNTVSSKQITLPYNFVPRPYQIDLFKHVVPGAFKDNEITQAVKRAVLVWHRRSGKDKCSINLLTMLALQDVGNYLYMAPEITQARKIIWQGIDKDGFRFIDHIPRQLVRRKTEADMLVELVNGSTIQLAGADMYDRNMGTNPKGIIFSEYSLMSPIAWNYYRPILVENGGVAIFIYTARGHNHGYDMFKTAKERTDAGDPNWYFSLLTIDDTYDNLGQAIITREDVDQEIVEGMPQEMVDQEFYCSFEAGMVGAYYADIMQQLHKQNRIGDYPHDPNYPVSTAWDLGLSDRTCVWYYQNIMGQKRFIDYDSDSGVPLSDWIRWVLRKPYNYDAHFAPHDLGHREYSTGKTRTEIAAELGIDFYVLEKPKNIMDSIATVREFLPTCVFNEATCDEGLDCLKNYTKVFDEKAQTYRERPSHDWASHGADAFRTAAESWVDIDSVTGYVTHKVRPSMGRDRGYWRKAAPRGTMRDTLFGDL